MYVRCSLTPVTGRNHVSARLTDSARMQETHLLIHLDNEMDIAAGVLFEYWSKCNCVLVTYLCVSDKHRRKGLAKLLIDDAVAAGDSCAKRWYSHRARATFGGDFAVCLTSGVPYLYVHGGWG